MWIDTNPFVLKISYTWSDFFVDFGMIANWQLSDMSFVMNQDVSNSV